MAIIQLHMSVHKLTGKWYTDDVISVEDPRPATSLRNFIKAHPEWWPVKNLGDYITLLVPMSEDVDDQENVITEILPPDCIGDLEKVLKDTASQLNVEADNELILHAIHDLQTRYAARVQADTQLGEILAPMVEAGQLPKDLRQAVQTLVDFQKLAFSWFTQKGVYPVEMPNGQVLWGWDGMEVFLADPCASPFDAVVQKTEYGARHDVAAQGEDWARQHHVRKVVTNDGDTGWVWYDEAGLQGDDEVYDSPEKAALQQARYAAQMNAAAKVEALEKAVDALTSATNADEADAAMDMIAAAKEMPL